MTGLWVALAVLAAGAIWYAERRLHPWRLCPSCGGSKKNIGSSRERWGVCRRCRGRGEVRRWGAGKEQ